MISGLVCTLSCTPAGTPPPGPRPNLLFVSIDTLRADHLGAYGYPRRTSPRLDEFAKTAILFEEAHSASSWTLPSLASLMTSLYPSSHGQGGWTIATRLDTSFHTLAEALRNAGYDTAIVASQIFLSDRYGLQKGFTHVDSGILQTESNITSPGITEKGMEWLREKAAVRDAVPWFLWLHYFDPHDTYLAHPGFSEEFGTREDVDLYDGEIAFTDHHVGRLLDELARLGLEQDTIVVVVADHGEEFGDHGGHGHGQNLYQEVVRVPLMLRVPGMRPHRVGAVVPTVDLMPTLLELCWASADFPIHGQSLLHLMRGEERPGREAMSELKLPEEDMRSLRLGAWKYIEQNSATVLQSELFALDLDPRECVDTVGIHPEVAQVMRARLAQQLKQASDLGRGYGDSEATQLSPAQKSQLKNLGYVEGDEDK